VDIDVVCYEWPVSKQIKWMYALEEIARIQNGNTPGPDGGYSPPGYPEKGKGRNKFRAVRIGDKVYEYS